MGYEWLAFTEEQKISILKKKRNPQSGNILVCPLIIYYKLKLLSSISDTDYLNLISHCIDTS